MALEVFGEVNKKRIEQGNEPLNWDNRIYKISQAYSEELTNNGDFSHIGNNGEDIQARLKKENLFYFIAGEIILGMSVEDITAQEVVNGWMSSPAHRWLLVDRDKFFTHGAVGVKCNEALCNVVLNVAKFEIEEKDTLQPGTYKWINLNDESLGLGEEYPVSIELRTSGSVDVYFFRNKNDMIKAVEEGDEDLSIIKKIGIKEFKFKTQAKKDTYMAILNFKDIGTNFEYKLVYN